MDTRSSNDLRRNTDDFLLAEYKNLADSFWRNEETGERRLNFFITLVTAVIAALVALATKQNDALTQASVKLIAVYALLALLAFGLVTLLRLLKRNRTTDEYKRAMALIRDQFRDADERLANYQPFKKKQRALFVGGLVEIVAVINSLIVAALVALVSFPGSTVVSGLSALAGFVVSAIAHGLAIRTSYRSSEQA
jgi:ABC-type multidrug transport system fused ATPase/permease subunit